MKLMSKEERGRRKQKLGACFGVGLMTAGLLSGCGMIQELQYQGKTRPKAEVEEMLSDYLESENPNMDLNVEITQDVD
jgi:hypothetical protein